MSRRVKGTETRVGVGAQCTAQSPFTNSLTDSHTHIIHALLILVHSAGGGGMVLLAYLHTVTWVD